VATRGIGSVAVEVAKGIEGFLLFPLEVGVVEEPKFFNYPYWKSKQ
jgi:hypothetical protein